jgi:hypothetical protein
VRPKVSKRDSLDAARYQKQRNPSKRHRATDAGIFSFFALKLFDLTIERSNVRVIEEYLEEVIWRGIILAQR